MKILLVTVITFFSVLSWAEILDNDLDMNMACEKLVEAASGNNTNIYRESCVSAYRFGAYLINDGFLEMLPAQYSYSPWPSFNTQTLATRSQINTCLNQYQATIVTKGRDKSNTLSSQKSRGDLIETVNIQKQACVAGLFRAISEAEPSRN